MLETVRVVVSLSKRQVTGSERVCLRPARARREPGLLVSGTGEDG